MAYPLNFDNQNFGINPNQGMNANPGSLIFGTEGYLSRKSGQLYMPQSPVPTPQTQNFNVSNPASMVNNNQGQSNSNQGYGGNSNYPNMFQEAYNQAQSFISANPQGAAFFGLGLTQPQQGYVQQATDTIGKLSDLYTQLAQLNAPNPTLVNLQNQINQQTQALNNFTPQQYLSDNPQLVQGNMTQGQLERTTALQRVPLEQSLSNLVLSKSALGNLIATQQGQLNAQAQGMQSQLQLGQSLAALQSMGKQLPAGVQAQVLQNFLVPETKTETKVEGGRQYMVTYLSRPGQPAQIISQQDIGAAPYNAFNFLANNPEAMTALAGATQSGLLNPQDINSRNMAFYATLYQQNPNFNQVAAKAAAEFYSSNSTQQTLAWANSVNDNLDLLKQLSDKVPRTDNTLINKAIIAGNTVTGDPNTVAFVNAANRLGGEISRVLGGSSATDFTTRLANQLVSPDYSSDQLKAAVDIERQMIGNLTKAFRQAGGQSGNQPGTQNVTLKDPKTGEVRQFSGLSNADLQEALGQGYQQIQ